MARRCGLCHSERHTYGAMKGLLQRRFSRVAVRGAAKVRLRALQAITGRIQGRFEVEEGKFYSAEDADRATSTNYLYQEPDCRVERLPDALASTLPGALAAAGEPNQSRRLVAWIKNPSRWDSFFAFFREGVVCIFLRQAVNHILSQRQLRSEGVHGLEK